MNKILSLIVFALIAWSVPTSALAQEKSEADYLLGIEDVISIDVKDNKELSRVLTIPPDGTIAHPEFGRIKATGKTVTVLGQEIQRKLEMTYNDPYVTVLLVSSNSRKVRVTGAVKLGAAYNMKAGWRLLDLISEAGGLSSKPVRVRGRIIHGSGAVTNLDVPNAFEKPDTSANILLKPNDVVILDEIEVTRQILVMGQVLRPGVFDLLETTNIATLLAEAGGALPNAALSQAYILRNQTKIPLNLVGLVLKGEADTKILGITLQPKDTIVIPENTARYAVLGQVAKPAFFPISEAGSITLLDALNLATLLPKEADLRKVSLVRVTEGKAKVTTINVQDMLKKGKLKENIALQAGDILFVPPTAGRQINFMEILNPLALIANIALR